MPWRDVAAEQPLRSPPGVGQHTEEVLQQFGIKPAGGRKTGAG
jgi:crotonobetainyl-CoA:carnitine CoA-transferase CaiB-like acyl-CoA transferase